MKKLSELFFRLWRPAMIIVVIAMLSYLLFFHNLAHLVPGYAPQEVATFHSASSLKLIANNPINAPYKIVLFGFQQISHDNLLLTRIVSATFAVIVSFLFFIIARRWYSYRIAFLVTILFVTSSGFLHVARLGTPLILQTGFLMLIACGIWWSVTKHKIFPAFCIVALMALLLYVPGMVWFEILLLCLMHRRFINTVKASSWLLRGLAVVLLLVLIAPLVRAFVLTPSLIETFLGLPSHYASVKVLLNTASDSLLSIGVHSSGNPELWVGNAPLLNIAELVLLILGIFTYVRRMHPKRTLLLFIGSGISVVLIGLGGPVSISSLVPLLYLLIAGGIYELLQQWFVVFPRNPFAQIAGVALVCLVILFSTLYQYRAYFVAWPNNIATQEAFHIQHL